MAADQAPNACLAAEPAIWGKTGIINFLGDLCGYRGYLELATAS